MCKKQTARRVANKDARCDPRWQLDGSCDEPNSFFKYSEAVVSCSETKWASLCQWGRFSDIARDTETQTEVLWIEAANEYPLYTIFIHIEIAAHDF